MRDLQIFEDPAKILKIHLKILKTFISSRRNTLNKIHKKEHPQQKPHQGFYDGYILGIYYLHIVFLFLIPTWFEGDQALSICTGTYNDTCNIT